MMQGNRKFYAYLLAMLLVTVLTALQRLDGQNCINGLVWIFGAYMGGNVGEHVVKRKETRHD